MNVGLYNLEPRIVNSAMMRVSMFHKRRGDSVELYKHENHSSYSRIYAFSIFDFTPKRFVTRNMITGGTGFNIRTKLPPEMEREQYDWSLYPDCDFSLVWFSTGCIRKCPFCVVPEKEGHIRPAAPKNLNPRGIYIKVCDNSFFANPKWRDAIAQLHEWHQPVDFSGGIDVRILSDEMLSTLASIRRFRYKRIKIAWDNPRENLIPHIARLTAYIKPRYIMCYVLIGFWSTES